MMESHLLPQPNPLQQLLEDFQLQQGLKDAVGVKDSVVSNKVGISHISSMPPAPAASQEEYAPRKLNSKELNRFDLVICLLFAIYFTCCLRSSLFPYCLRSFLFACCCVFFGFRTRLSPSLICLAALLSVLICLVEISLMFFCLS